MKKSRESKVEGREPACSRHPAGSWFSEAQRLVIRPSPNPAGCRGHAFTLIEIMVAVGIIAIIMTIAIPSVYKQMHKDSMRQAVSDLLTACGEARARAILNGVATELRIRPGDRSISVVESASQATGPGEVGTSFGFADSGEIIERRAPGSGGGGGIFSAQISDHIIIEFIGVNLMPDLQQLDEVSCMFYPNGTSDELVVLVRSDQGEIRKITTEVVTGIADVEVVK